VKRLASAHAVPVWQPTRLKDEAFLDELRALAPDLAWWPPTAGILPDACSRMPRLGLVNVHASLLPAWRGASPVHRAVMAATTRRGDDHARRQGTRCRADPREGSLSDRRRRHQHRRRARLAALGPRCLLTTIDALERGGLHEVDQDHARATFAPRLTKEEGSVDWSQPAPVIRNRIRGLQPWPSPRRGSETAA